MRKDVFARRIKIEAPAEEVFQWHTRDGAFERLMPPWEQVEVIDKIGGIKDGDQVKILTRIGPIRARWTAEHRGFKEGREFRDIQISGPFAYWEHTHSFEPTSVSESYLEDRIEYALPFGALGRIMAGGYLRRKLERLFDYRHRVTSQDIKIHKELSGGRSLKVLVTGSSGLVGTALIPFLTTGGHRVSRLIRGNTKPNKNEISWNPELGTVEKAKLEEFDVVVLLAGENIAARRWTPEQKSRIRDSRVRSTRLLCEALGQLNRPPGVLISASATGYYGDRADEVLLEESEAGVGFLSEVCREWEEATEPAAKRGIRVVNLRFGVVLSPKGGALAKMLLPFQFGLGGKIGRGDQFMSWISIDDVIRAIYYSMSEADLKGPVNMVSPNPVTNLEFTRTLGQVLSRPTIFAVPAFAARLLIGEMADALLLSSARVYPGKLLASGYNFLLPELEDALRLMLGKAQVKAAPVLDKRRA
jgi:uncharacterized protein